MSQALHVCHVRHVGHVGHVRHVPRVLRLLLLLSGLATGGCGAHRSMAAPSVAKSQSPSEEPAPAPVAPAPPQAAMPPGLPSPAGAKAPGAPQSQPQSQPQSKLDAKGAKNAVQDAIIYEGRLAMRTREVAPTIDRILDTAEKLGGHLLSRTDTDVEFVVPSASFRAAIAEVEKLGEVTNRSVTAQDVSEEYSDLEVRLQNLRATRARLQEFLGKAHAVGDMLVVERELERVAQEIDRIEGRLQFLRARVAMSHVSVKLSPIATDAPVVVTSAPRPTPTPIPWVTELGIDPVRQAAQ